MTVVIGRLINGSWVVGQYNKRDDLLEKSVGVIIQVKGDQTSVEFIPLLAPFDKSFKDIELSNMLCEPVEAPEWLTEGYQKITGSIIVADAADMKKIVSHLSNNSR